MDYRFNFDPIWRDFDNLLAGLALGLGLSAIAIAIGIVVGLFVAFGMLSQHRGIAALSRLYVTAIRNTPLLLIIFFAFFALPQLGIRLDKTNSFVFSLAIYSGAYIAEIFRGGLIAIPKGLTEAGMVVGLRPLQIKLHIIIPVALRNVLPSLGNAFISLFKDTSLAAAIAVPELTFYARKINVETFRVLETWIVASLLYVSVAFLIATALRLIERQVRLHR